MLFIQPNPKTLKSRVPIRATCIFDLDRYVNINQDPQLLVMLICIKMRLHNNIFLDGCRQLLFAVQHQIPITAFDMCLLLKLSAEQ